MNFDFINPQTPEEERDEIIANAEAAYRRGELDADDLLQIRILTAKELLDME